MKKTLSPLEECVEAENSCVDNGNDPPTPLKKRGRGAEGVLGDVGPARGVVLLVRLVDDRDELVVVTRRTRALLFYLRRSVLQ